MREKAYQPHVFDSIDSAEPAAVAEAPAEAKVEVAEAPKAEHVFARGEERFQKAGEKIGALRDRVSSFFASIPQVAKAWSRKAGETLAGAGRTAAIGVLSAPELVSAGIQNTQEAGIAAGTALRDGAEAGSRAFLGGVQNIGESINAGADSLAIGVLDTAERIKAAGIQKGEQFQQYVSGKAEDVRALAELTSNFTKESAEKVRAGIDTRIQGITSWGANSLALAEAKRQEAIQTLKRRANESRMNALRAEVAQAEHDQATAMARAQKAREKLDFQNAFAGGELSMAA